MRTLALASILLLLFLTSCQKNYQLADIALRDLEGKASQISLSDNPYTVIYFISPECPLCQNYTLDFRELHDEFSTQGINFYASSGEWYTAEEIKAFQTKYDIPIHLLIDPKQELTQKLGATITPEVFLLQANGDLLYSGKIDNWVNALGKKKLEVSETYLRDAILASLENKPINPKSTKAIGCLIE